MIKTLQISSILAVVMAGVLFVSSIVFGAHQDEQIEEFLKSPSAKEQFQKVGNAAKVRNAKQSSPLVDKAELFAKILNPIKPKPKFVARAANTAKPVPPKPVETPLTAKYKLYGTVVCESNPEMSLALLEEPGKGLTLVRQGSEIMRTTIELVMDGKIMVRDSRGTVEMTVEEGPAPASVAAGAPAIRPPTSISSSNSRITSRVSRPSVPPRTGGSGRRGPVTPESIRSRMTNQENARLSALGERLKAAKEAQASKVKVSAKTVAEEDAKAAAIFKKLAESVKKDAAQSKDPNGSKSPPTTPAPPRRGR